MSTAAEAWNPTKSHRNNHVRPFHHAPPAHLQCQATPAQVEASACKLRLYPSGQRPLHPDLYRLHPLRASDARISADLPGARVWLDCSTPMATRHSIETFPHLSKVLSRLLSPISMDRLPIAYDCHPSLPTMATFSHLASPCQDRCEVVGFSSPIHTFKCTPVPTRMFRSQPFFSLFYVSESWQQHCATAHHMHS